MYPVEVFFDSALKLDVYLALLQLRCTSLFLNRWLKEINVSASNHSDYNKHVHMVD